MTGGLLTPWRLAAAAGLVTLALGSGTGAGVAAPGPAAPTPSRAWMAAPLSPVVARAAPKASARVVWRVPLVGTFRRDRTKLW